MKYEASLNLLRKEVRYSGLLLGELAPYSETAQSKMNVKLFKMLEKKFNFFYNKRLPEVKSDKDILMRAGMDIAESSLRTMLDSKSKLQNKLESSLRLLNVEMRGPGLLQGKLKAGFDWKQYGLVQKLYQQLEKESAL
jgi:hypothetical protein